MQGTSSAPLRSTHICLAQVPAPLDQGPDLAPQPPHLPCLLLRASSIASQAPRLRSLSPSRLPSAPPSLGPSRWLLCPLASPPVSACSPTPCWSPFPTLASMCTAPLVYFQLPLWVVAAWLALCFHTTVAQELSWGALVGTAPPLSGVEEEHLGPCPLSPCPVPRIRDWDPQNWGGAEAWQEADACCPGVPGGQS